MNETEYLLTCLSEECAEVAHRVSKALRFGLKEKQKDQEKTNAERICDEFVDLMALMEMLSWPLGALIAQGTSPYWDDRIEVKKEKVRRYLEYAKKCGTVT